MMNSMQRAWRCVIRKPIKKYFAVFCCTDGQPVSYVRYGKPQRQRAGTGCNTAGRWSRFSVECE